MTTLFFQRRLVVTTYLIITDICCAGYVSAEISDATKSMIEDWAPKMWVHHEEAFRPSNVEYFLKNTRVRAEPIYLRSDSLLVLSPSLE